MSDIEQACNMRLLNHVMEWINADKPIYSLIATVNESGQPHVCAAGPVTPRIYLRILSMMADGLEQTVRSVPAKNELQQEERQEVLSLCRAMGGLAEELGEMFGLEPPDEFRLIRERNKP